jgi:hypothetical protein
LLYHYTDAPGFAELRQTGALRPEDLVIRHRSIRLRRPLTWLTDDTDLASPAVRTVARLGAHSKITVRLTISTAYAQRWPIWKLDNRVSRRHSALVDEAAEGLENRLWVVPGEIAWPDWIIAEDVRTAATLWRVDLRPAAS